MKKNIITIKKEDLIKAINETVLNVINEKKGLFIKEGAFDDYDDEYKPDNAERDFYDSGCDSELENRYPDIDFEFEISTDGTVTATNLNTGEYYTGCGDVEYRTVGTGKPSKQDPYSEEEISVPYYDFYGCMQTIMRKIDNAQPDGNNNS